MPIGFVGGRSDGSKRPVSRVRAADHRLRTPTSSSSSGTSEDGTDQQEANEDKEKVPTGAASVTCDLSAETVNVCAATLGQ